jgi:hypothetical protein
MTGHFVTACGCEAYRGIEYPPSRVYRMPTRRHILRDECRPFSTPRDDIGSRLFELESVNGVLAEYREVYDGR